MSFNSVSQLVSILQTAIGPAILISGIGLLLLTMTNRLGRVVDRARKMSADYQDADDEGRAKIVRQIRILWKRARLLRLAIMLAASSALLSSALIILLFLSMTGKFEIAWLIASLFGISMACLMGSIIVFIKDINQALRALRLELVGKGIDDG